MKKVIIKDLKRSNKKMTKKQLASKKAKTKLKIAILTQGFRLNVAEAANITIRMLAEYLSEQGHEVIIFCNQIWGQPLKERIRFNIDNNRRKNENKNKDKDDNKDENNRENKNLTQKNKKARNFYTVIRQPSNYDSKISANLQLFDFSKMIKQEVEDSKKDFDIIHNFSASPVLAIRSLTARRYSRTSKVVQTIKAKSHYFILNSFTYLLNFCDAVTVPTNFLKRDLLKWGLNSSKVKIIPSYINIEKFKPQNKNKLKARYGYDKSINGKKQKVLLYYGHLSEKKG